MAELEEHDTESLANQIQGWSPEELDAVTRQEAFRLATAELLAGNLKPTDWREHVVDAANAAVDVPLLTEAQEQDVFNAAFDALGAVLDGLLHRTDFGPLEAAITDLMNGALTVPEFLGVAGDHLNEAVDIPYVPEFAEDLLFSRGVEWIAKILHGYFKGGSQNV